MSDTLKMIELVRYEDGQGLEHVGICPACEKLKEGDKIIIGGGVMDVVCSADIWEGEAGYQFLKTFIVDELDADSFKQINARMLTSHFSYEEDNHDDV